MLADARASRKHQTEISFDEAVVMALLKNKQTNGWPTAADATLWVANLKNNSQAASLLKCIEQEELYQLKPVPSAALPSPPPSAPESEDDVEDAPPDTSEDDVEDELVSSQSSKVHSPQLVKRRVRTTMPNYSLSSNWTEGRLASLYDVAMLHVGYYNLEDNELTIGPRSFVNAREDLCN